MRGAVAAVLGLLAVASTGLAREQAPDHHTDTDHHAEAHGVGMPAPRPGNPAAGERLFREKGCIECHAIKGKGGDVGPDLGRMDHTHNIYQMAGVMWNHAVHEQEAMERLGLARVRLEGREMADLLAYLHSLEVVGDPERGRVAFEEKGCVKCHSIMGKGGKVGPSLAPTTHPHRPIELAGLMWNHSPTMSALMASLDIRRPAFEGNEMADLLAYIDEMQRASGARQPAGAPGRRPHHHD